jgi:hypothetical protein
VKRGLGRGRGSGGGGGALQLACRHPSFRRGTFFVRGSHVSHNRRRGDGGVLVRQDMPLQRRRQQNIESS